MLAEAILWFFLVQMPDDESWIPVGNFDSFAECEARRMDWTDKHPNFISQPCQQKKVNV